MLPRDRVRERLEKSALFGLVTKSHDGVVVFAGDEICWANAAFARILRLTSAQNCVGKTIDELVAPADRQLFRGHLSAPKAAKLTIRLLAKGQENFADLVHVESLAFDGVTATALVFHDVSRIQRLQARMMVHDRMTSIGTLAAGVAHEINNPLSYVVGNLLFLKEEAGLTPTAEVAQALEEAREGAERVRAIVRDLQTFARADHQRGRTTELRRTIELAINMAWAEIRHRARLSKQFEPVPDVEASEAKLGQVFVSLLLDAAHALPEGSADKHQIRISTVTRGSNAVVEIARNTPPPSPEVAARIFDPFATFNAAGVGNSVALSIAHSIVEELGGTIEVDSKPAPWTVFRVILPGVDAQRGHAAKSVPSSVPHRSRDKARVLVIDDEPLVASLMRRALREHDVIDIVGGHKAIESLRRDADYDVIFCDLMMPDVTGMDVHDWLAEARPGTEARIVFITGGTFTPRASEFLQSVPNTCFAKPFDLEDIRKFVTNALGSRPTP